MWVAMETSVIGNWLSEVGLIIIMPPYLQHHITILLIIDDVRQAPVINGLPLLFRGYALDDHWEPMILILLDKIIKLLDGKRGVDQTMVVVGGGSNKYFVDIMYDSS